MDVNFFVGTLTLYPLLKQMMQGNSKEWVPLATGLTSSVYAWDQVNPLLPYAFRVIGRNRFGEGHPSRATHVDAQVGKWKIVNYYGNEEMER